MTAVPGAPLDLAAATAAIERADESVREQLRRLQDERRAGAGAKAGSLGRLDELAGWLAGVQRSCPPRPLERVRAVVFAGDHGVAASGTTVHEPGATARLVRELVAGSAPVAVIAEIVGAGVRVVDVGVDDGLDDLPEAVGRHKVRRGSGHIAVEDAMSRDEARAAVVAGMAVADEEVDAGADLLVAGSLGAGATTPAAVLVGLLTRTDASLVVGRGSGIDDAGWMRKGAAVRDAMRRGRPLLGDQVDLLAAVAGADLAALTGFLLQAAARRTPVLLDGVVTAAAALVAHRAAFRAVDAWLPGDRSAEPAQALALERLSLEPLLDLGLQVGQGAGALLAVPLLRAAAASLQP